MSIIQALVLGVVQGISEFLPISSSGHLILVPQIFGWADHGLVFDVAMHLATLIAIVYVFWSEIKGMLISCLRFFSSRPANKSTVDDVANRKLALMIIVATIPAVIVGLMFGDVIEATFRSAKLIAVSLIFWGLVLAIADKVAAKRKTYTSVGWKQAIVAGIGQAIALIPGTSRSGITISAGLFTGMDRIQAARFSFLLSIPAIAGAVAFTSAKIISSGASVDWLPMLFGFVSALVAGIFSIRWLLRFISKTSYVWFAVYRIIIATIILTVIF